MDEYGLPVRETSRGELEAWIASDAVAGAAAISARLESLWSGTTAAVTELRALLLAAEPTGIVCHGEASYVRLVRSTHVPVVADYDQQTYFAGRPLSVDEIHSVQATAKLPCSQDAYEFIRCFNSLRDSQWNGFADFRRIRPLAGAINADASAVATHMLGSMLHGVVGVPETKSAGVREVPTGHSRGAWPVYSASTGDKALLLPSGEVGWWVESEGTLVGTGLDLCGFFQHFVTYQKYFYPFDSYGSRDELGGLFLRGRG